MSNINLSGYTPAVSSKQVQALPTKATSSLPPAELSKQLAPTDCLTPKDQTNLPKSMAPGSSQAVFSFLDQDLQAEDLPSKQEVLGLLQEIGEANKFADPSAGPLKRRYLDDNITKGKPLLEKIRQAANQEPGSVEAKKMLWLLEEHNKITQGYRPKFDEHLFAYGEALKEYQTAKPEQREPLISAEDALKLREQIKQEHYVRTLNLIKP